MTGDNGEEQTSWGCLIGVAAFLAIVAVCLALTLFGAWEIVFRVFRAATLLTFRA